MSQVAHPRISVTGQLRSHRVAVLSALLALLAMTAVVLVIAIDGGSPSNSSAAAQSQAAVRTDGGPEESAVAASVGSRASAGPNESSIAAAVAGGDSNATAVDEARVAASVSGR